MLPERAAATEASVGAGKCRGGVRQQAASSVVDGGRGVRDLAYELDINDETRRNWVGTPERECATPGGPVVGMSGPSWPHCAVGGGVGLEERSWGEPRRPGSDLPGQSLWRSGLP